MSEEKLEPRLGERFSEPGMELEQPLCVAWHISQLDQALAAFIQKNENADSDHNGSAHTSDEQSHITQGATSSTAATVKLAAFLLAHPEFRHVVRRAQMAEKYPYMEIRDNLIDAEMLPTNMLRLKLSFFGVTRFDPRSDRWERITMFQHAPFPHELMTLSPDGWVYPPLEAAKS